MATQWINKAELKRRAGGISDATEWRWRKAGILPEPTYFGPRSPRWDEAEVDAALERLRNNDGAPVTPAADLTAAARKARALCVAERRARRAVAP